MKKLSIALVLLGLLLAGCTQPKDQNGTITGNGSEVSSRIVEVGDTVKVEYRGGFENGEVFDSSESHGASLEFVAGMGRMIKGFDEAVVGMRLDQEKTVTLQPSEAYGFFDEKKIVEIPKENVGVGWDEIKEGTPISSPEAGNGIVIEKKENSLTVDFNHPLAGKTLVFWIKVVEIEKSG